MALQGKVAVVTGGSGIVGSGIIHQFLLEGATVIAPVRSDHSKSTIFTDLGDIGDDALARLEILVVGDYASPAGIAELATRIRESTPEIDHVISCFGGSFKMGTASVLSPDDIDKAMERAIPHLLLASAFFPLLAPDASSSFTFITGMMGERCSMPNAAALTISNAAIYGIIRAFEAEQAQQAQRINEIRIAALIRKDAAPGHPFIKDPNVHAYPASLIGEKVVEVAVGPQRREIIRIWPDDLAEMQRQTQKAPVAV